MNTLNLIAQTAPASSDGIDWKFVVTCIIGALTLLNTIFGPMVRSTVKQILDRLERGDEKFEEQGQTLAVLGSKLTGVELAVDDLRTDLKTNNQNAKDLEIEGQGTVAELRIEMEREFLRKKEFGAFAEHADRQHNQIMEELRKLERRK